MSDEMVVGEVVMEDVVEVVEFMEVVVVVENVVPHPTKKRLKSKRIQRQSMEKEPKEEEEK